MGQPEHRQFPSTLKNLGDDQFLTKAISEQQNCLNKDSQHRVRVVQWQESEDIGGVDACWLVPNRRQRQVVVGHHNLLGSLQSHW